LSFGSRKETIQMHIEPIKRMKGTVYKVHVKANGQHITKTFSRKHDAELWGTDCQRSIKDSIGIPPLNSITFAEVAEQWMTIHCRVCNAPSVVASNASLLKRVNQHIGHLPISNLSKADIELLRARLKAGSHIINKTINRYLRVIHSILSYAIENELMAKHPFKEIGGKKSKLYLTEDQVELAHWQINEALQFVDHAQNKYSTDKRYIGLLYKVALNTGLRWGEIIGLKWDCVHLNKQDPKKSMIVVKRSYCSKTNQLRETTKSHKIRYVGINEALYQPLLETYQNRHPQTDFVFHTLAGTQLKNGNFMKRYFYRDIQEAGVSKIRFHDLRHTYASAFVTNGGSIYDLQKILGHSDIVTTMRYAHLAQDHILSKSEIVVIGKRDNVISVNFNQPQAASL
jgi:integrase